MEYRVIGEPKMIMNFKVGDFVKSGSFPCIITEMKDTANGWVELWNIQLNRRQRSLPWWYAEKIRIIEN